MGTDMELVGEIWKEGEWHPIPDADMMTVDIGRHYDFYAVLANVRSSGSFGGPGMEQLSHGKFQPISEPRGMPLDITQQHQKVCSGYQHPSFRLSWLKVREIIDYDWDQRFVVATGYIQPKYASLFKEDEVLSALPKRAKLSRFPHPKKVAVSYLISYRDHILPDRFITQLMRFGDPDTVRIIFWFD